MTNTIRNPRKIALIASKWLLFSAICLLAAAPARAQFVGYTSPQTVSATYSLTNQCNGITHTFDVPNVGQSVHFLRFSQTGNPNTVRIWFADENGDPISDTGTLDVSAPNSSIITANGYYSLIQIEVSCTGGTSPVISLDYFGTSANSVPVTGVQDTAAWYKIIVQGADLSVSQGFGTVRTPYGNSCGQLLYRGDQMTNSGTLTVAAELGSVSTQVFTYTVNNTGGTQAFNVPCVPADQILASYVTASGTGTFSLYYAFYKPGLFPNMTTPTSGTSATLPIQVVSDLTAQSFSANNSVVDPPTGTVLFAINPQNGSKSIYLDKFIFTSTVNVTLLIYTTSSTPINCATVTPTNIKSGSSITSAAMVAGADASHMSCAGFPTGSTLVFNVPANDSRILDLRGWIGPAFTNKGFDVQVFGMVTGTVYVSGQWYEQ